MSRRKAKPSKARRRAQQQGQREVARQARAFRSEAIRQGNEEVARQAAVRVDDPGRAAHTCADGGVSYGAGVTVAIGEYEFARVYARAWQRGRPTDRERLWGELRGAVREFLGREAAALQRAVRLEGAYPALTGADVAVELLYGWTLRAADGGSRKRDVGVEELLGAGDDVGAAWARLAAEAQATLRAEIASEKEN